MSGPASDPTTAMAAGRSAYAPAADPLWPFPAVIRTVVAETPGVFTLRAEFEDRERQDRYRVAPGQFNMLYLMGLGEVPISVSGATDEGPGIGHTIRSVGRVTQALESLPAGSVIGVRGPYGSRWPLDQAAGRDVVIVAGGLGLAPLRLAIRTVLARRPEYGRVVLIYGARRPADLLFAAEYPEWERRGLELHVTVDQADASWPGNVGVVPLLLRRLRIDPARTVLFSCGPEIMMRLSVAEAIADRIPTRDVHVSLERNMQCAVGLCGHCQLGPDFLCKDGPVLAYSKVARFLNQKDV
jgi:NAD(P)H-flavin reductase